jgi:hypothetical protein
MVRTLVVLAVLAFAVTAFADWDPGMPAKWVQLPQFDEWGVDVNATYPHVLADDFLCTEEGPITDIHIWGSWLNNHIPFGEWPEGVMFILSIHSDIPDSLSPTGFSMPGEPLWWRRFLPGEFTARIYAGGLPEGWLNPPEEYWFPGSDELWQYNFHIDDSEAFIQQGSPDNPVVYWLDVQAIPEDPEAYFGWKTSLDHWNDDATWIYGEEPIFEPWFRLTYPPGHPYYPESIDLAFVINGPEMHTFKWEQLPDLDFTGIDVYDSEWPYMPIVLADDYLCTEEGRVVEVKIWGSWYGDWYPFGADPGAVEFTLSFHSDIPDSLSGTGYSMPDEPLWVRRFLPGEFFFEEYATNLEEGFMWPPDYYEWPADFTCWLYTFRIDPAEAFLQEGTPEEPIVYWLDCQAAPHDMDAQFGWKTSLDHWNDDAVWGEGLEPYWGPWWELRYPPNHPFFPESIDLAFSVTSEPDTDVPGEAGFKAFGLEQNTPNPFNPITTIKFVAPVGGGHVTLEVIDVAGRVVRTLVDGHRGEGEHGATWNGRDEQGREVASGVYFYRLTAPKTELTRKMLLLK